MYRKKATKPDTSLEERIRQLTCDVDEHENAAAQKQNILERRGSPTGEENPQPQVTKYVPDKSFSPVSTASSSSSSSISAYKKITEIFHKDKRQERIPEADENPIVIIPQVRMRRFFKITKSIELFKFGISAVTNRLSMSIGSGSWNGITFVEFK